MKIDLDYIANILDIFIEADSAHISILYLKDKGIDLDNVDHPEKINENFIFHIQLMAENSLISDENLTFNGLRSIGISIGAGGGCTISGTPIRLTQSGHDFAKALVNKEILSRLKNELKDAPFKTIFDGSQKLLNHYLKSKIDSIFLEGT